MQLEAVMRPVALDDGTFTRLLARNLKIDGDLAKTVRWQYLEGPSAPGHVFLLHGEHAAVGCAGVTSRELWYRGRALHAAHFANFTIDRTHRTGLPALVLQRA